MGHQFGISSHGQSPSSSSNIDADLAAILAQGQDIGRLQAKSEFNTAFQEATAGQQTNGAGAGPGTVENPNFDYSQPGFVGIPEFDGDFFIGYDYRPLSSGSGSGAAAPAFRPGELALLQAELAERERSARASEAITTRGITLDRALGSLTAYNTAQDIANDRRLNAFDQARQLSGFLVDPDQKFFSGLGPDSALAQVTESFGLPFEGNEIQHVQFRPQSLQTPGVVPAQVNQMLEGLRGI